MIIGVDLDFPSERLDRLEAGIAELKQSVHDGLTHIGAMKLFHAIWYLSACYPDTDGDDIQDALEILGKSVKELKKSAFPTCTESEN